MARIVAGLIVGILLVAAILGAVELAAREIAPGGGLAVQLLLVAGAYFVAAAAGAIVAGLISRRAWTVWAIALLVTAGSVWTSIAVPQPFWMKIAAIAAPLLAGLFAQAFVAKRLVGTPRASDNA